MIAAPSSPRRAAQLFLTFALLASSACVGQDLAHREGIHFRYSALASFRNVPPESTLYRRALTDALATTSIPPERLTRLPRVVRGTSFLVDPPYLGYTRYREGLIFVWEGTEVPLDEVLLHEMVHWVLYAAGEAALATNETYVAQRVEALLAQRGVREVAAVDPNEGRWRDIEVWDRNQQRHRHGIFGKDEPDSWALAHEGARTRVEMHPSDDTMKSGGVQAPEGRFFNR